MAINESGSVIHKNGIMIVKYIFRYKFLERNDIDI